MADDGAASTSFLVIEAPSEMVQILAPSDMVRSVLDTLGGAEGTGAGQATSMDGGTEVACWMLWSKIRANFWMAWSWASRAGMGVARVLARVQVELTASSAEELLRMGQSWGKIE